MHVATGGVDLNGQTITAAYDAALEDETEIRLQALPSGEPAEMIVFDLA